MKKATYPIVLAYSYDPSRNRAHYTFNGENYMNNGDFSECILKAALGYDAKKDGNTPFDKGSDIEELHMSVKSARATLANEVLGADFDSIKAAYFARVKSTAWAYVTHDTETLTAYYMDKVEFEEFMNKFGYVEKSRSTIRFRDNSREMINWLEDRAEE